METANWWLFDKTAMAGTGGGMPAILTRGQTMYELSNHLDNVLVTVSDRKVQAGTSGTTAYYTADVVTATDYYPGGMLMPGRKYSSSSLYRYGFNGKENDNDVKGEGNQQDYGLRIYDPRLVRFLSVDPLAGKFPMLTPYQFASNTPIWVVDLDGAESLSYDAKNSYGEKQVHLTEGTYIYSTNSFGIPVSSYVPKIVIPEGKPMTQNMTDVQVYQLAFSRFVEPGKHLANPDQYLDTKLMKAEEQVNYFFSHQVPAYSKSDVATKFIHTIIAFSLMRGDESAVAQIQKSDDFSYRHNWGSLIVAAAPIGAAGEIRTALAAFAKIEARGLKLLANEFKANWATGDITATINKLVGKDATFELTESGKIIWKSESSTMQVIQDPLNKYFRVLDTKLTRKRSYTDLNGTVPNNKVVNGKTTGNSQAEYDKLTHFKYE